ncbi:hypothetical protein BpHYR1_020482 [Brachionus plicatilis]|uniref:Uncharacterized protein n=1 Tax=Brachionus plicatilis TaxID=10195 RepID=A0A3M7S7V3_BRAPC|nr:hypothetical protein BpHYR1_020482 [Brachionus plicatilis]
MNPNIVNTKTKKSSFNRISTKKWQFEILNSKLCKKFAIYCINVNEVLVYIYILLTCGQRLVGAHNKRVKNTHPHLSKSLVPFIRRLQIRLSNISNNY